MIHTVMSKEKELGQFFTPVWAAQALFDAHFGMLTAADMVWEPTCGKASMLSAIPANIPCIGSEIDPVLAEEARISSGRPVITGNCLSVELPPITAVFGNPPFNLELFLKLLRRCDGLIPIGNKAAFIIPAYFVQTSRTVMEYGRRWGIHQEILPRDLFPGLSKPLIFGTFIRDNRPHLVGFRLFPELASIKKLSKDFQENISNKVSGTRGVWRKAVSQVITELGGSASLTAIYSKIEGRRPTENEYWKEQIRLVCQRNFNRIQEGVYSLNA